MANLDVAVKLRFLTLGEEKLKAAARDVSAFGKSLGQLSGRATGRFGADLSRAYGATAKLGGALDKSATGARRAASGLAAIGASAHGVDKARSAVDRLTRSTAALDKAERRAPRVGMLGAGVVAGGALRRHSALREGLAEAASRVTPNGYLLGAGGAIAAGAALGGAAAVGIGTVGIATKEAIDRNKAFADIQKKVTLDAGQSWDDLDRKVRKVAITLGKSYGETASIFAQGGQGNIATRDLEDFAMLGAKVSTAWDIGGKDAAQTLTEIHGQTGWNIRQMETFADKVNFMGDISAAAEKDIAAMWQRASAGAKAAGVSYDDSMVLMTGLRSVGMQDEVAARFVGQFTSRLRRATSAKGVSTGLAQLGLSAKDIELGMQTDAMKTMVTVLERLAQAKNAVAVATDLGGGEWFDEILRMKDGLPEILRLLQAIRAGGFQGSLDKALVIDLGTTQAKLSKLKESLLDIMDTAARPVLLPWIDKLADGASKYAADMRAAQEASEKARARAKPVGESAADYERRLHLDRPIRNTMPMMSQIEGTSPHLAGAQGFGKPILDTSQFAPAAEAVTNKSGDAFKALQELNTTVTPTINADAAVAGANAVATAAERAAGALRALQNFGAPGGGVSVPATRSGAAGGGSTGGAAPSATPGKQARLSRSGVQIATAHFHGVKDVAGMHRQLAAIENRRIRLARDNALHDIGRIG